mmetsp:Transcript_40993/g.87316  ORF Transcript_40993/g.87316 Transcript_40993/m.87316 type:complete len:268 (+) Transcript_40993:777-1580(+)
MAEGVQIRLCRVTALAAVTAAGAGTEESGRGAESEELANDRCKGESTEIANEGNHGVAVLRRRRWRPGHAHEDAELPRAESQDCQGGQVEVRRPPGGCRSQGKPCERRGEADPTEQGQVRTTAGLCILEARNCKSLQIRTLQALACADALLAHYLRLWWWWIPIRWRLLQILRDVVEAERPTATAKGGSEDCAKPALLLLGIYSGRDPQGRSHAHADPTRRDHAVQDGHRGSHTERRDPSEHCVLIRRRHRLCAALIDGLAEWGARG